MTCGCRTRVPVHPHLLPLPEWILRLDELRLLEQVFFARHRVRVDPLLFRVAPVDVDDAEVTDHRPVGTGTHELVVVALPRKCHATRTPRRSVGCGHSADRAEAIYGPVYLSRTVVSQPLTGIMIVLSDMLYVGGHFGMLTSPPRAAATDAASATARSIIAEPASYSCARSSSARLWRMRGRLSRAISAARGPCRIT
jgi:hypothetical protein